MNTLHSGCPAPPLFEFLIHKPVCKNWYIIISTKLIFKQCLVINFIVSLYTYLDLEVQGWAPHLQTAVDTDASPPTDRQSCGRWTMSLTLFGNYLELHYRSPWLILVRVTIMAQEISRPYKTPRWWLTLIEQECSCLDRQSVAGSYCPGHTVFYTTIHPRWIKNEISYIGKNSNFLHAGNL